jgi:hypothetical protein
MGTPMRTAERDARRQQVRQTLLTSPLLTSVELRHGSGVILCTHRDWHAGGVAFLG